MKPRTAPELRAAAAEFREMAAAGGDIHLQEALRLVADEFELEANRIESLERKDLGHE